MLKEQAFQICGIFTVCGGSATAGYFALKKNIFDKKNPLVVDDKLEEKQTNTLLNPEPTPSKPEKQEQEQTQNNNLQLENNQPKTIEIKPKITPPPTVEIPKNVNAQASKPPTNTYSKVDNKTVFYSGMIANLESSYGDVKVFYEFVAQNSCAWTLQECFGKSDLAYEVSIPDDDWSQQMPVINVYLHTTNSKNLKAHGNNNLFKNGTKYLMEIKKDHEHKLLQGKKEERAMKLQTNGNYLATIKLDTLKQLTF